MVAKSMPSAEYLRRVFTYSAETGTLFWNNRSDVPKATNNRFKGKKAGSFHPQGLQVRLNNKLYFVHRIIYLMLNGDCLSTTDDIDHKDLNQYNNLPNNIRKATRSQNSANKPLQKNNVSGAKNVCLLPSGRWQARIGKNGRHIGCFNTREEAVIAYDKIAEEIYGDYRRVILLPL